MFPIFIENFKYLDKNTNAITIGPFVFCKPNIEEHTRNHELIHHQQNIETLYIGLLVIYAYDYIKGLLLGKDSYDVYMSTCAEIEAYNNENNPQYLSERKRYQWLFPPKKTLPKKTAMRRSTRIKI